MLSRLREPMEKRDLGRRIAIWASFFVGASGAVVVGWMVLGPIFIGLLLLSGLLYGVARYDNHTGSCLTVTILVLIVIAVLLLLMVLLVMLGRLHG
jgi:predicted PurR-regulated permease PerM